jgi:agmatine/peptidylarginine deiminase
MIAARAWRLPAEWEPQDAVLLAWPHEGTDWAPTLEAVEGSYAALIAAITRFERVVLAVADATVEARARKRLATVIGRVHCVRAEYDDTWLRDSGPITLTDGARFELLDFRFTGWGGKFEAARDDRLVEQFAAAGLFARAERRRVPWALEGGAIESDGAGAIMTTYRCLHQRHPQLSRGELGEALGAMLHAERVLMLEHGFLEGDDTDAHIDTLARFATPSSIVYQACDRAGDPHYDELKRMGSELAQWRDAQGRPYRLSALPWTRPIHADDGRRLAASYANFLIVNGAVLAPVYGDSADAHALNVLGRAFAEHEIVPVPCRPLIEQNGSLHCLTMQLPRGVLHVEEAQGRAASGA